MPARNEMIPLMRVATVFLALGVSGCDLLFQVQTVKEQKPPDAHIAIDAPGCWDASLTHNEDTDPLIDGCDNCPLDDNENQMDSDGDGVGDACDPHPTDPVEQIAYFHPMDQYVSSDWFTLGTGSWTTNANVPGFGVKQTDQGKSGSLFIAGRTFEQPFVEVAIKSATAGAATPQSIGAYVSTDASGSSLDVPNGVGCGVGSGNHAFFQIKADNTPVRGEVDLGGQLPGQVRLGTREPGVDASAAATPTCRVSRSGGDAMPLLPGTFTPTGVHVGVFYYNSSVTFSGIFVLERRQ